MIQPNAIYYDGYRVASFDEDEEKQLGHCLDCGCGLTEDELDMKRSFCFSCLRPGGDRIDD